MDRERPRSVTPQSQKSSQRRHGLKMQMLPVPNDLKPQERLRMTQEEDGLQEDLDEYQRERLQSSFERDEDFKFKRHKHRNNAGTASLGERLDNIHEQQRARWMDNFNSSANMDRFPRSSQRERSSQESQHPQQSMLPLPTAPYMPYMYYYPYGPPMAHPHMSTSPSRAGDQEMAQYVNSSQGYPNTSTQPFMPPMPPPNSQLMPPPPLYPGYSAYNYYNDVQSSVAKKSQQRREKRNSLMAQRGRRLSLLSLQDNSHIISPHKDVPEHDFYRHIANTSFGQDLQIRQLFSWCLIRCLRKWENTDHSPTSNEDKGNGKAYVDPKRISLVIIKEFVEELRKGKLDVSWDVEESEDSAIEDNTRYQEEDTELRELFEDDDDDDSQVARKSRKRRSSRKHLIKLPNEKNVQNAKNLHVLQKQIDALEDEIKRWIHELDEPEKTSEWQVFGKELANIKETLGPNGSLYSSQDLEYDPVPELEEKIRSRMDNLYAISHFLHSNAEVLSHSAQLRLQSLSNCINLNIFTSQAAVQPKENIKSLLTGLSRLMARPNNDS
ncbi:LANO_0F10044g1_1 [Lachancea nothofagi CBS 11611]|uniref:LANO_0F10044g1_1 n=1 Tax=Lachancea nothofagi CBS 11611 TaxID=1266666 RepID=A0A1G4KA84_9SACH|nr:LANO_0F10044g1_1 [Lachancea nothofagi CBS 11611]